MKILYNTQTQQLEGKPYEGEFSSIYNSGLNETLGWLPEYILELNVVQTTQPEFNYATQRCSSSWIIDTELKEYRLEWTIQDKEQSELDMQDALANWKHAEYALRIVAPVQMIMDDMGIKMFGWFQLNNLPVVKIDDTLVHLYCNVILPEHQSLIDSLTGIVSIEEIPEILK